MPARLSILQIGKGTVGAALLAQVARRRHAVAERTGVALEYAGILGRSAAALDPAGIDPAAWRAAMRSGPVDLPRCLDEAAAALPGPRVLVDATDASGMADLYLRAFGLGFHVVTLNKKPLAGPYRDYLRLQQAARSASRYWLYEVTVGAGLPVLGTLRDAIETGDRIDVIEGCFSGTLNFLCAALDRGLPFSAAVGEARERGYTEPDPREDLSGRDVARKVLILAREAGLSIELEEVRLEPFCRLPEAGAGARLSEPCAERDGEMARAWGGALERGARLRYVGRIGIDGCAAALREVPADSPLGRLAGPENIFAFTTGRYDDRPLVVAGPGAGAEVTAAGAFGDLLVIARAVALGGGRG